MENPWGDPLYRAQAEGWPAAEIFDVIECDEVTRTAAELRHYKAERARMEREGYIFPKRAYSA